MLTNATRAIRAALMVVLVAALGACGGGGGGGKPDPVPPSVGTVTGTVSSVAGTPLANVAVASGGRNTTTAADGRYSLTDVPVGDRVVVSYTLAGHVTGHATLSVAKDAQVLASPRLLPVATTQMVDAAAGGTVAVAGTPAQVVLPAGGLVGAGGAAASGQVTVAVTPIDPATDPASMPGNFTAAGGGGATTTIESFGALNVDLRDAAGQPLNLAAGQSATIRIPLATRSAGAPTTIPLYWFNEQTGLWVQEGTATLQGSAPDQYYEGTVSHFSTWNADQPMETIFVNGCVQDGAGARVQGVWVHSEGVDYSGGDIEPTNAQGDFRVGMRRGGKASIYGQTPATSTNVVVAGPSQVDITLPACLVLAAGAQPPSIVVQPQSQGLPAGGFALFTVQAIGSQPLAYQWRRNGENIVGQNFSVLLLQGVQPSDHGARFSVVVTNAAGSVTSDEAVLSVDQQVLPPLISADPQSVQVTAGQTASFSVTAQSRGGQLSFQWQRDGVDIPGATTASYTTAATVLGDHGARFAVVVRSTNGTSATSAEATLSVVAAPVAPAITQQPAAASVNVGQSASFSVAASGTAPLRYQWRKNGTPIANADQASYTTPATVLADNGAVFTVVVSNAAGDATSNGAALTVTQVAPTSGYHHYAEAGTEVTGSITFFNGSQGFNSAALVAVAESNPGAGAITVEPAGTAQVLDFAFSASIGNGAAGAFKSRYLVYTKGGRFHVAANDVPAGGSPAGRVVSTLTTAQVCGQSGRPDSESAQHVVSPELSWHFLRAPGADGNCFTADDETLAFRLNMSATDAPVTVAGVIVKDILAADGMPTGHIFREGTQIVRRDVNLGGRTLLFTVLDPLFFRYETDSPTPGFPGIWLFVDASTLYGVNLNTPGTRVVVTNLQVDEIPEGEVASDGTSIYMSIANSTTASSRLIAIDTSLQAREVRSFAEQIDFFALTPSKVAVQLGSSVVTVPKAGGAPTPLFSWPQGDFPAGFVVTSGENVYLPVTTFSGNTSTSRIEIAASDGGNRQTLADTAFAGYGWGTSIPIPFDFANFELLYTVSPVKSAIDHTGATLRALDGATRATRHTYGTVQASPAGVMFADQFDNFLYGDAKLFSFMRSDGGGLGSREVYFLDSDQSNSLVRVTNLVTGGVRPLPAAAPGRTGKAAAGRSGRQSRL